MQPVYRATGIFLLLFPALGTCNTLTELTNDFFQYFTVNQIVMFGCWESQESVEIGLSLMRLDKKFSYIKISNHLKLQKILKVDYYKLGVLLDLDCPGSENVFNQFWDQHLRHNESYFWLMPTSRNSVPKYFEKLPLNIGVEMTVAIKNDSTYSLYDIYNPSYRHGGKLNITFMGSWSYQLRLNIVLTQYKYQRRGNFFGLGLNVSVVEPVGNPNDPFYHFNVAMMHQLSDFYNYTINWSITKSWGYTVNGSFNGMIGDMVAGIVDIGCSMQHRQDRMEVADFTTYMLWAGRPRFFFRHPKKNSMRNPFLEPFEKTVWHLVVIVAFLNWIMLYLCVKIEENFRYFPSANTLDSHPITETVLITAAAICQQGLSDGPRFYSGRIIFLTIFFWGLFLYQYYSASIVGSLLAKDEHWIKTPQNLLDSSLECGIDETPYMRNFFETAKDPVAQKLYKKMSTINAKRNRPTFMLAKDGMKLVQKGDYAFQVDMLKAYRIINKTFKVNEICELVEIKLFHLGSLHAVTSKQSQFKKMVTYGLRHMLERGTAHRLLTVGMPAKPQCPESYQSEPNPIVIGEFSPALFALAAGILIALAVMLIEHVFISSRNKLIGSGSDFSTTSSRPSSEQSVCSKKSSLSERT